MEKLKTGERYTVDCSQGSTGYPGEAHIERTSTDTDNLPKTKTKIKLILGNPDSEAVRSIQN
jgi:pyruvate,water dikinase